MQRTAIALLAAITGLGLTPAPAGAQQYPYPYNANPQYQNGYPNQCYQNRRTYRRHDRDDRNDGDNDRDDRDRDDRNRDRDDRFRNGNWHRNGAYNCYSYGPGNSAIRGAIVGVNGNWVTLQTQNFSTITINDQPALNNQTTGRVAIGRLVTAYGYWQNGTFFATQLV